MKLSVWKKAKKGPGLYESPAWWRPAFWLFVWRWRKRLRNKLVMEEAWYRSAQQGGPDKPKGVFMPLPPYDGTAASWDKDRIKQATEAFRNTYDAWDE